MKSLPENIPLLTVNQQQDIIKQTEYYIKQATALYNLKYKEVEITFNLKGRSSGMYRVKHFRQRFLLHKKREIRYNPFIFAKYYDDNFATTIPHEVAHFITDIIYGLKNIKPHGQEWQAIMHAFGADASVTANYDLSGIPLKKQTQYTYICQCREHQLSSIRHNKISKRRFQYFCKNCKQVLHYKQIAEVPTKAPTKVL